MSEQLPKGVSEITLKASGLIRYQAIAKINGRDVYLGWYTTPKRAHQAYLNATQPSK